MRLRWRWLRSRSGGARRKLIVLLMLVVGAIAVLPTVIAKTSLRNVLLSRAVPGGAVRVSAADALLSWVSAPVLVGVNVVDSSGAPLLAAERISVDKAPTSLALDAHDLGVIEIVRPTIHLKVRADGSNLEDAINAVTQAMSPAAGAPPAEATGTAPTLFAINVVEGIVLIDDVATGRQWRVEGVNAQYDMRGGAGGISPAMLKGRITQIAPAGAQVAPGDFSIALQPIEGGKNQLTLQVDGVSLAIAEPWLRRFAADAQIAGTLAGQGTATWTNPANGAMPSDLATSGAIAIDGLDATAAALEGDRLRLTRVELPWRVAAQPNGWSVEDFQFRSEAFRFGLRGYVDPNLATAQHDLDLRGDVNLAMLARMLPHALHVRQCATITDGTIELAAQIKPNEGGQIITGAVRTARLAATSAGKPLRWEEPVSASFAVRRNAGELQVDSLKCDSEFLKMDAAGTPEQFTATASFDLNKLAEQLGQFVELGGTRLAGTGTAKLDWQTSSDQFTATATADLAQLAVSLGDGKTWSEPHLAIRGNVAGVRDAATRQPARVDSAKLEVNGQGDLLDAQLVRAVALTSDDAVWPFTIKATGGIARWLTRVRPWFAPGEWQIDGQGDLVASVNASSKSFQLTSSKLAVNNLRANAPGWNIHEPRVEFAGDARLDFATSEASSTTAQLVTSTVSVATRDVRYRAGDAAISQLTGAAAFRVDVARLAAWRAPATQPAVYRAAGEMTGNLRFAQQGDRITGELNATGRNLALASLEAAAQSPSAAGAASAPPSYKTIWQEPNLLLRGFTSYQSSSDRLSFEQLEIQSNTLQAAATGAVEKLSTSADINITGTVGYDLAQVTPLLKPYVGSGIQLTGKEQARFAMAGKLADEGGPPAQLVSVSPNDPYRLASSATPANGARATTHWSRRVKAQLELPWGGANVYGLPVGAGKLAAVLGDGVIRVEPLSLAVGEGTLTAAPHVRFDPEPAELTLPPGPLITNVRISPEVSEAMLKYVAPVLAGATQSDGQFSMQLDGTRVPLEDSKKADVAGKLSVHSVRVVPGAMANQLIGVAQQVEALARRRDPAAVTAKQVTLLNIRDQEVNFRVIEGRVHHQNLEFQVNDIVLRSQGSVGFDQTVQLTLLVPIQDDWIAKEPLLAGFKGQSLQIPVSGTLSHPQLDQRAIASLSQQLLQGAAQQAIGGELNKALDKIFKPRK
jgi:translocation and assembly module TamB